MLYSRHIRLTITYKYYIIHKTGSTLVQEVLYCRQRRTTTATGDKHRKFDNIRTCESRQTDITAHWLQYFAPLLETNRLEELWVWLCCLKSSETHTHTHTF